MVATQMDVFTSRTTLLGNKDRNRCGQFDQPQQIQVPKDVATENHNSTLARAVKGFSDG